MRLTTVSPRAHTRSAALLTMAAVLMFIHQPGLAQQVYQYTQSNGTVAFSDRPPQQRPYRLLRFDCYACKPKSKVNWQTTPLFTRLYPSSIQAAAQTHRLDPALIRAVIHAESGFNTQAVSKAGAQGLMQLMPATALSLGVENSFDSHSNIMAGSAYLAKLLQDFAGDTRLATAAYNAGPATVSKYAGIPPYAETKAYVKRVHILLARYRQMDETPPRTSALP